MYHRISYSKMDHIQHCGRKMYHILVMRLKPKMKLADIRMMHHKVRLILVHVFHLMELVFFIILITLKMVKVLIIQCLVEILDLYNTSNKLVVVLDLTGKKACYRTLYNMDDRPACHCTYDVQSVRRNSNRKVHFCNMAVYI